MNIIESLYLYENEHYQRRGELLAMLRNNLYWILRSDQKAGIRGAPIVDLMSVIDDCDELDVRDRMFLEKFDLLSEKIGRLDDGATSEDETTTNEQNEDKTP